MGMTGRSESSFKRHVKDDHGVMRCHLKGARATGCMRCGTALCCIVLYAAGDNIRRLLRMIAKKGVTFLQQLYLRLCTAAGLQPTCHQILRGIACIWVTVSRPAASSAWN